MWDIILDDEASKGRFPVTSLFTIEGDETNDPSEASTFVASRPDGKWIGGFVCSGKVVPRRHQ